MKRTSKILILLLLCLSQLMSAQVDEIRTTVLANVQRCGGSSAPYEYVRQNYTPAPRGYRPFYISHFGRHGSRYHTSPDMFRAMDSLFRTAEEKGILTEYGKDIAARFKESSKVTRKYAGDLSEMGVNEHIGIASRMFRNYPGVFKGRDTRVEAVSTTSPRVILSMAAFCETLKSENRFLNIRQQAGDATSAYLNHYTREYREYYSDGEWRGIRDAWVKENINPSRIISSLFKDSSMFDYKDNGSKALRFVQDLFSAAAIMPASGLEPMWDIFNDDELFILWQAKNMEQYMRKGPSGIGHDVAIGISKPLLRDFVEKAGKALEQGTPGADLRFGHGEGIMPLSALMGIEEASRVESDPARMYLAWQDFRITTMAANIQWVFYKNAGGNILVKVLLNERESTLPIATDTWPYYRWEDMKSYYDCILK